MERFFSLLFFLAILWLSFTNPTNRDAVQAIRTNHRLLPQGISDYKLSLCRASYWLFSDFYLTCEKCSPEGVVTYVFRGCMGKVRLDEIETLESPPPRSNVQQGSFDPTPVFDECQELLIFNQPFH